MLTIDIRSLESQAVQVDGRLATDDPVWEEGDPRPAEPVHVTGRLSTAGAGRYYFSGQLEGVVRGECRRCLTDVTAPVADDVHLLFIEDVPGEIEDDDPDVYRIDSRAQTIDLRPAIREHWLLSAPTYALCREDCAGICPSCGADRNAGACACPPPSDSRWEALRKLRSDPE